MDKLTIDNFDPEAYDGPGMPISALAIAGMVNECYLVPIPKEAYEQIGAWFTGHPMTSDEINSFLTGEVFKQRYPWAKDLVTKFGYPLDDDDDRQQTESFMDWRAWHERELDAMEAFVAEYGEWLIVDEATEDEINRMTELAQAEVDKRKERDDAIERLLSLMQGNAKD